MNSVYSVNNRPVLASNLAKPQESVMKKQFVITFDEDETLPDYIEKAAEHHGITPETFIKRVLNQSVDDFRPPMKALSEFDSLDEFLKGNGFRK